MLNNDPKLFIAEKFVKKGFLIINAEIEFDENGNLKNLQNKWIYKRWKCRFVNEI